MKTIALTFVLFAQIFYGIANLLAGSTDSVQTLAEGGAQDYPGDSRQSDAGVQG